MKDSQSIDLNENLELWFLDDHSVIHRRLVVSVSERDAEDGVLEVQWHGNEDRDYYFRKKTYHSSRSVQQMKEQAFTSLSAARREAIKRLRKAKSRAESEAQRLRSRIQELVDLEATA